MKHLLQPIIHRLIALVFILLPLVATAKPAYKITLQVDGCKDSMLLMCFYYAQSERIADTAFNNGKGRFVFEGEEELKPGLYFFTNNTNRYVEFVIYNEKPNFQFHTDDRGWTMNMKVKGSRQNEIFYKYQRGSETLYKEIDEAKGTMDSAALAEFTHKQHLRVDSLKLAIMKEHPDAMISKMMN